MSNLSDRISYLRGLAEGLKVDEESSEGKLIVQLIGLLSEVIGEVDDLKGEIEELNDYVESIDEDLTELEDMDDDDDDFNFDDDDDDDFELIDYDDDEGMSEHDYGFFAREDDLDDDEGETVVYAGCVCPECRGLFRIEADADETALYTCPHCDKAIEIKPMDEEDDMPVAKAVQDAPEDDE